MNSCFMTSVNKSYFGNAFLKKSRCIITFEKTFWKHIQQANELQLLKICIPVLSTFQEHFCRCKATHK